MTHRKIAVVAAVVAAGVGVQWVRAQPEGEPCEAFRDGDIVTVNLATCEEVPSSTTIASTSTTVAPPSSPATTTPSTSSPPPETTTTVPAPTTSSTSPPEPSTTTTTQPPASTTTTTVPPGSPGDFVANFATPEDFFDRFQTEIFHGTGDITPQLPLERNWFGDHDDECHPPDTHRPISVEDLHRQIYWCAPNGPDTGHVMTSMFTSGYAQIDIAPDRAFNNVRRVCWDQNNTRMGRMWTQVVVVPESVYQANGRRLGYVHPGLENDVAIRGVRTTNGTFLVAIANGSTEVFTKASDDPVIGVGPQLYDANFAGFETDDPARRWQFCVTDNENGTVTFNLERPPGVCCGVRTQPGRLPNGPVRVIFQHDVYDAPKGNVGYDPTKATVHWDGILIDVAPLGNGS